MAKEPCEPWVMPEWMRPYEPLFHNTGGNTVEDLMTRGRCEKNLGQTNIIVAALVVAVESQIALLSRLHHGGYLAGLRAVDDV